MNDLRAFMFFGSRSPNVNRFPAFLTLLLDDARQSAHQCEAA